MKKRIGLTALLLVLCLGVTSVFAMPEISTQVVGSYMEVTISGALEAGEQGIPVALTVEKEGTEKILHVDQMISEENGLYRFHFTANPEWGGGIFRYELTALGTAVDSGTLELSDIKTKETVRQALGSAQSADDVKNAMQGKDLGLNLPVYEQIDKNAVYEGLYKEVAAGKTFADVNEMDAKIRELTVLAAMNQSAPGMLDQNKLQYLGLIGVDEALGTQYRTMLSARGTSGVNGQMLGKGFSSAQEAAARFECVLYTNLITGYKAVGTGHIDTILKDQGTKLGIDYQQFVSKGKPSSVLQALAGSGASTPEALAQAYASAIAAVGSGGGNGGGGGGGSAGGGGGGSTGGTYLPPVDPIAPVIQPDTPVAPVQPGGFTDIESVSWAKDAIVSLKQAGVINGKTETEFAPDDNVTREEFVKMLMTALNLQDDSPYVLPFGDVQTGDWYYDAICTAAKKHVVTGVSDTWFGVGEEITRQDMVTIAFRALRLTPVVMNTDIAAVTFEDQVMIADYAAPAAKVFKKMNLISGYEDGAFRPAAKTTRAEAAKLIYNMLQLKGVA